DAPSIRRPARERLVCAGGPREPPDTQAVEPQQIELEVAVAVRDERELPPVRRPGRHAVVAEYVVAAGRVREPGEPAAVDSDNVQLRVEEAGAVRRERDPAAVRRPRRRSVLPPDLRLPSQPPLA